MSMVFFVTSFTVLILFFLSIVWFSPESRLLRWAKQASRWDYATANARFQEARQVVVGQLRHPNSEISKSLAEAAFDVALACSDRLNELNGKPHGPAQKEPLRRALLKSFRKEAEYWGVGDYGIDSLGCDQEPSLYASQRSPKTAQDLHELVQSAITSK
ncbi:MAG: hypothetical protein ABIW48_06135 [Burkholderiales bacterium]|nr:hypothetical protein [Pseudomonadota bacterium]